MHPRPNSYCTGGPDPGAPPNNFPITTPTLHPAGEWHAKGTGGGGRLFNAVHEAGNSSFPVIHLYGSPYEMGFAQGALLKKQAVAMYEAFWAYLVEDAGGEAAVEEMIIPIQRDSAPFVSKRTTEEIRGLQDATGYNATRLLWLHLFPESSGGHCSMFGAWGSATRDSYNGETLQMRALDYMTDNFLADNHALTVYHPRDGEGHAFINVGFAGISTVVTGISTAPLALSQIGVSNPDDTFGPQRNGKGTPFIFLLRDLLQDQSSLEGVRNALGAANRTLDLILGFGTTAAKAADGAAPFTGVQYAAEQVRFYDDTNMLPVNASWHAPVEDVVYHGMDWDCPGWTKPLGEKLRAMHGKISAEAAAREVNAPLQTGNLHVAIYEIAAGRMLLAHAAGAQQKAAGGPKFAYERPYMQIDVRALLAERL